MFGSVLRRLYLAVMLAVLVPLAGLPAHALQLAPPVVLQGARTVVTLEPVVDVWLEPAEQATIAEAAAESAPFAEHRVRQPFGLQTGKTLWIRLRVLRAPEERGEWMLDIPVPYLDAVSLYQRDLAGRWTTQFSGDTLPRAGWSQQGLHPAFKVTFASDGPQELYLQIRNMSEVAVPIRLVRQSADDNSRAMESLVIGWVLGMLLTVAGFSLVRFLEHRNRLDLGAVAYALLVSFAIAQVNGVLGASLWADLPTLNNYLIKMASSLGVGGSLLFLRHLYALSIHYHRFDRLLWAAGWTTLVAAFGVYVLEPGTANLLESLVYVVATTVALVAAILSWRDKSLIWPWLMLATVPQSLGILWLGIEMAGLVEPIWQMRYYTSLCAALSVPVLAFALRKTTQERMERAQRANQLATQDALTGLLNRATFDQHLQAALTRARDQKEPVALAVVCLVNHARIVASFGHAVAEQCELRAVVKLHRVLHDVDPASRIGTGQFALLLQGVSSREQLTRRMVQLIASGLTPPPGLHPPVPLQFHVACAMLHERPVQADTVIDELLALTAGISVGTRRPIRFLEAALPPSLLDKELEAQAQSVTRAGALGPDISLP